VPVSTLLKVVSVGTVIVLVFTAVICPCALVVILSTTSKVPANAGEAALVVLLRLTVSWLKVIFLLVLSH
jgi:hypothetical protein